MTLTIRTQAERPATLHVYGRHDERTAARLTVEFVGNTFADGDCVIGDALYGLRFDAVELHGTATRRIVDEEYAQQWARQSLCRLAPGTDTTPLTELLPPEATA